MNINTFSYNIVIVSFKKPYDLSILYREFSSNRVLFKPSKVDVSAFSDNTTEKDLQEYEENQTRRMTEFKDRHSEEELYAKTAIFDSMDKDSAEALRDEIKSELVSDTRKLKEELREDVGEMISDIKLSSYTEESKEQLIAKLQDHLKINLEDADNVFDQRSWALDDSWDSSKHAEDVEMSSVGSYEDSDNNNSNPNKEDNDNNENVANKDDSNSNNSRSNVSNNKDIDSESSPLGFVIEKENCTSIYDIEILNIDEFI